jgi:hypothetical protein
MATTFGTRPEDTVADSRGNVLSGVVLTLYPSKADAQARTSPVTTVSTNGSGLFPYDDPTGRVVLWARDPAGNVWAIESEGATAGDFTDQVNAAKAAAEDAAASAASAASLVNAPADSAIAAAITPGSGSASEAVLNSTIAAAVDPKADQSDLDDVIDGTTALPYAQRSIALQPPALVGTAIDTGVTLTPIEVIAGQMWASDGSTLKRSSDGVAWTTVASGLPTTPQRLIPCAGGEMLILNGDIWRSSGWASNPATATWTKVVTKSAPAGPGIRPWGLDGDGTKFIATEYSGTDRAESRYVWVSTNAGASWTVVLDKTTIDPSNLSHMHGVCYDPWEDRFWLSHGHDAIKGLYYSEDDGVSWTMITDNLALDASPTVLIATDDGIVCGSDSTKSGLFGIPRTADPATLSLRWLARWVTPGDGVVGFADRGYRDPDTGYVWVSFTTETANSAPAAAGGTARAAAFVWDYPTVGTRRFPHLIPFKGILYGTIDNTTSLDAFTGAYTAPGVAWGADAGNIRGGASAYATSVAVGPASAVGGLGSVAVGREAATTGTDSVAIGYKATTNASTSVAVGREALAAGTGVAVGKSAICGGLIQTIIGASASGTSGGTGATAVGGSAAAGTASTAVGRLAVAATTAGQQDSVAIGQQATAANQGTAVGRSAAAPNTNAVAIGYNTTTTAGNQVALGARHIEITEVAAPGLAPTNGARLYVKDNGSGKTQLVVRFQSGAEIALATEA